MGNKNRVTARRTASEKRREKCFPSSRLSPHISERLGQAKWTENATMFKYILDYFGKNYSSFRF